MIVVLLVCLLVGFLVGLAGVGGILVPPVLILMSGLEPHTAMGTALASFIGTGFVGTWLYHRNGHYRFIEAVPFALGSFVCAAPGALVNARIDAGPLVMILAVIIIFAGACTLRPPKPGRKGSPFWLGWKGRAVIGGATGFMAGLTGAGGPVASIPWMVLVGYSPIHAVALSMPYQIATSFSGSVGNMMGGHVDWLLLPALCAVLLLGRQVFAWPGLEWLLLAAALALPLSGVLTYGKPQALTFTDVCAMAAAGFAIPWAFSGLYGLRMLEGGYLLVLTPLVAAFCSDALALFTGMALGRHKLAPLVSPHKTVEGAAGGLVGGMAGMAIFCLVYRAITGVNLGLPLCVALGLLGALLGELGDLSFSAVKRQYGIKDYGRLLPGHGGVLDRFDSVLFAAPVLCALLRALAA